MEADSIRLLHLICQGPATLEQAFLTLKAHPELFPKMIPMKTLSDALADPWAAERVHFTWFSMNHAILTRSLKWIREGCADSIWSMIEQ
jgi:hypothetical protein